MNNQKKPNLWENAKRITLKEESYRTLAGLKVKLKARTWEDLIRKLKDLVG
jgi:hypothetical protein